MLYWLRELLGWLLIAFAIRLLIIGVDYAGNRQVVEAGVVSLTGLGVLRAGVLLVRLSTAARIALRDFTKSV